MNYVCLKARAKINIALDILGKRPDGYHDMRMIMQSVSLHDDVLIRKTYADSIILNCDHRWVPIDNRNLAYRAAEYMIHKYGIRQGVYIQIKKNIPVSAGLAGGSADCAATLYGMRLLFDLPIADDELMEIGKSLGADVPFCIARGTMLAEGIGEVLTRLDPHPPVFILLAKPYAGLSTATVFDAYRPEEVPKRPDIDLLIKHIGSGDVRGIAENLCNVLEPAASAVCPAVMGIKQIMAKCGAYGQAMTGSGPTVFGYFPDMDGCFRTMREIRRTLPQVRKLLITRVFNI